jgi:hypothetical protein
MREDGDGRFCERCQLRVTEVAKLDDAGLERVVEAAESERVCVRLELDRPRTALGIAAGLVIVTLAGCATPLAESRAPSFELEPGPEDSGAVIAGLVVDQQGSPIENAIVILQSTALPQELECLTTGSGVYSFAELPPGNYTIQVLAGRANVSKIVDLPVHARFRANFSLDPDEDIIMGGMLFEPTMIDTTSASSTFSSKLIEYE